ncbi:MAG: hypothetical protein AAF694_08275 [Bacteroidota bacterium]
MKELNKKTLQEAIDRMPTHKAPEEIWAKINEELTGPQPRRQAPIWYAIGVAAMVLIGLIFFTQLFSPPVESQPVRIETETAIDSTHQIEPLIESHVGDSVKEKEASKY